MKSMERSVLGSLSEKPLPSIIGGTIVGVFAPVYFYHPIKLHLEQPPSNTHIPVEEQAPTQTTSSSSMVASDILAILNSIKVKPGA